MTTVPSRDARGPVTPAPVPASFWRNVGLLSAGAVLRGRVLAVAAHPDDEVIGAGALLAEHAAAGRGDVRAVTLTAGERCVRDPDVPPERLARRRLREWRTALRSLGGEPVETERWPDGALGVHEDDAIAMLVPLLAEVETVVAVWAHDPHPDHQTAGRAARRAAARAGVRLVEYAVWAPYWLTPAEVAEHGARLAVARTSDVARQRRRAALDAHRSQVRPLRPGWEPVVPAELVRRNRGDLVVVPDD